MTAETLAVASLIFVVLRQLRRIHLSMNSRLDELLETTGKLARAEGFKAGQENHLDALRAADRKLDAP